MSTLLVALFLSASTPAQAGTTITVDADAGPVELQATVKRGVLDLCIDGACLRDAGDSLDIVVGAGGAVELGVLDAIAADGTVWTVQVTAWEGRTADTWERDEDGAWTLVEGEATLDLSVVATSSAAKGESKPPPVVTYGPVITIKPKG